MSTTTLTASSDAYTNQANSATNYGTAADLRVGNDGTSAGTYDSLVTFDLSTLTSNLGAAFLTLHGAQTSGQTGLKVYDVTTNPSETGVTWATQPSADQLQSVTAVGTSTGDYRFDVLPYLQYAKANSVSTVTFMVVQDTTNGTPSGYADFSSREGATAPVLVAYTNDMVEAPTADAWIDDSNPSTNYGSDTTLLVGSGFGENSYGLLGFDLSGVQGTPTKSYLHLWADALIGQDIGIAVKPVTGAWTESGVTWNNKPSIGSSSQYVIVGDGTMREYTLDVSDLVTAAMGSSATHVDFELQETSVTGVTNGPYIEFNSREASSDTPSLVFSGSGTPTVLGAASASQDPNDVGGIDLQAFGGYVPGESNLTYTWACTSSPSGSSVTFPVNGEHDANSTEAEITQAGTYGFQVTISSASGSVTSATSITIAQRPTTVSTTDSVGDPGDALSWGQQAQFIASVGDQFRNPIGSPSLTWSVSGAGGTIDSTGSYTAPSSGVGTDEVTVTDGSVSATIPVDVGNVTGHVTDDELGRGESGFDVYLDENDNGVHDFGEPETATDSDGDYALTAPPSGYGCQQVVMEGRDDWDFNSDWFKSVVSGQTNPGKNFVAHAKTRNITVSPNASIHIVQGDHISVTFTVKDNASQRVVGEAVDCKLVDPISFYDVNDHQFPFAHQRPILDSNGQFTYQTRARVSGNYSLIFEAADGSKAYINVDVDPAKIVRVLPTLSPDPVDYRSSGIIVADFQVVSAVPGSTLKAQDGDNLLLRLSGNVNETSLDHLYGSDAEGAPTLRMFNGEDSIQPTSGGSGDADFDIQRAGSYILPGQQGTAQASLFDTSSTTDGEGPPVTSDPLVIQFDKLY